MQPDAADMHYTIHDPFAEALYCRRSFTEAARIADRLGAGLIVAVRGDDVLDPRGVVCRYRRGEGGQWRIEAPSRVPAAGLTR